MNQDENSKGSTDDSGIALSTSLFSNHSQISTNSKTFNRKRSLAEDDTSNDENDENGPEITSRKEKSLGKLCKRFLLAMDEESRTGTDVHLETVAKKMNVEKRRIYDIVNVMEALEAMSKTNKSFYRWKGIIRLPVLMHELAEESKRENLAAKVNQVNQAMCSFTELTPMSQQDTVGSVVGESNNALSRSLTHSDSFKNGSQQRDRNGKNSLAQLCRRFLMVLLCNPKDKRRVSLDVASTVLIKDTDSEGFEPPSRSRCRRLYDIANVLVAMGLIKKVHYLFGTKKIPLFEYFGPEPEADPILAEKAMNEFFASAGLTDGYPVAAKLRRISSDQSSTTSKALTSTVKTNQASQSLSRTLSDLQNAQNIYHNQVRSSILAELARQQQQSCDDKENVIPKREIIGSEILKPVPRPLERQPLGQLTPQNYMFGFNTFNNIQKNIIEHSMNSILYRKTPVKQVTMPNTKVTDSPKAFKLVIPTHDVMCLTSICNGQPKKQ